jgi:hypothetical protein
MATIKSYTDIEQSKKLANILPTESADMYYDGFGRLPQGYAYPLIYPNSFEYDKPCWSLTSLLSTFPVINSCTPSLRITITHEYYVEFCIDYFEKKRIITDYYESPVDACVAMIERLHELKIL